MIKSCGQCEHVGVSTFMRTGKLAFCKKTDAVVPHKWDGENIVTWRVPMDCPLDEGVHKSEKIIPESDWVQVKL